MIPFLRTVTLAAGGWTAMILTIMLISGRPTWSCVFFGAVIGLVGAMETGDPPTSHDRL